MLYEQDQQVVFDEPIERQVDVNQTDLLHIETSKYIKNPLKWSAEHPHLYTLVLSLVDATGNVIETESCKVGLDRKSTRLNSSHVAISYAVFCLKKKRSSKRRSDCR